jgi:predicted dehydrogenase
MNRRTFVATALAGGGSGITLMSQNAKGANDKIALAVVGTGVMGTANLEAAMDQKGVAIAALCDVYQPNLERATAVASRKGHQPKQTADFREILANPSIDAICIATPDHWHPYITVEACKAGKDVYVEKPTGVAVDEGFRMVEAARKYQRIVQAGTWQRSGAHFQKAREIVRSGELGKIAYCKTWIYNNAARAGIGSPADGSPPAGLNWDLWQGPAAARPFNGNRFGVYPNAYSYFRFFWDYAGGILTDSGVHMIDVIHMAFDEVMPKSISAIGGKFWFNDNTETPDTLQVSYEYPDFLLSWEHRSNNTEGSKARLMGATFHGTNGTLYVDRAELRVTPENKSMKSFEMKREQDPHPLHWANFLDCVRTRRRPNSDIETCARSSAACILGNLSYRTKMRIDWDDANKTTVQEEPRRFLKPVYRAPWKLEV